MRMAKDGRLRKPAARELPQVLGRLLPPELWRSFGRQAALRDDARTHWTAKYVVLCWAMMGWARAPALGERFEQSRAAIVGLWPSRRRPGRTIQGLMKAGRRVRSEAFLIFWRGVRQQVARRLGLAWNWHGWVVFAVDGSRIDAPRTRANEKRLGCAGRAKSGPQWWVTTIIHLPSRLLWSWRQGGSKSSERGHLRQRLGELPANALLLGDAGFVGFGLLQTLIARGTDFVIRCGSNVNLLLEGTSQHIEKNGASQRVYLWPQDQRGRPPLMLRLIQLKRGGKRIYLLTNVLDSTRLPIAIAGELYAARWGIEVNFRSLKQTLERRKLLARTPAVGELELAGNLVALGLLLAQAAWLLRRDARRASVAAWLRVLRRAVEALVHGRRSLWFARIGRACTRDSYERRRSKRARDWPHKKNDSPPGAPKIRKLSTHEKAVLKRLNEHAQVKYG